MPAPEAPDLTRDPLWWARSDSRAVELLDRAGCAVLRRGPENARARWRALVHRGDRVECLLCGARFRHFQHARTRANAICWRCESAERHRALHLMLTRQRPELLEEASSLLHFAPEPGLERILRGTAGLRYASCDIDPDAAELRIDITAIDLPDASVDAVICSHVLEHVPDDAAAMRELFRVLAPSGWCVVMVPMWGDLTDEDPSVVDEDERRRRFWQEDHVRLYGFDIVGRLEAAGFQVERFRPAANLPDSLGERYALGTPGDDVFVCRKPADLR